MVEVKPINLSFNQHSSGLSVRTAISPTLTEGIIIHPSVYSEVKKLGHAKSDVLLNESESSLGAHAYAYPNVVSVSNVIENSSYDLPHVKNFNTRNDLSSLVKNYKCNKIKSTKLKMCIKLKNDIPVCQRTRRLSCSDNPSPMKSKYRRFAMLRRIFQPWQWKRRKKRNRFEQTSRTLQRKISMRSTKDQLVKKDVLMPVKHNVFLWNLPDVEEVPSHDGETILLWSPWKYRCGQRTVRMAVVACSQNQAVFARRRSKSKPKQKLLDIRAELERERRTREVREQALPSAYHRQTYLLK
ncbi:phosphatase and actin regulator 2 [Trichonephila clavipes]|nr:phosphatase and actin regulator 2 [Trichonephila clavipes]